MKLELVRSESFGTIMCDFYSNGTEFWMTREQIGDALGYTDPRVAITKIHQRHQGRLDKFSVVTKLVSTDGKAYETYLYSAKGIFEICRWSQQSKADSFMDWVWNILEGLRNGRLVIQNTALDGYMAMSEEDRAIAYFQSRKELKQLQPKAEMHDRFLSAENAQSMGVVAKALGIGPNKLFRFLRDQKILLDNNVPYQEFMKRGYFRVVEKTIQMGDREKNIPQTLVTSKGVDYIAKLLKEN